MPIPTQSDVHVNVPLTNLSEAYAQDAKNFVAGVVFPPVPVQNKSNVFYRWNRADLFRHAMQKRAPGTRPEAIGQRLTTGTYTCDEWALANPIPDGVRRNADAQVNLDYSGTNMLTQQALLNREINWNTAYFGTGLWGTDITGVASAPSGAQTLQWSVSATSSPVTDILTGKETVLSQTGFEPNTLVLGYRTKKALKTNGEILDRLKYGTTDRSIVTVEDSDLAQLFEIDRVVTMKAIQTTSAEGAATDTFDFIGGKNALLAYAAPAPGLMVASAGYTFNWTGSEAPYGMGGSGWRIKKYRDEPIASDVLEIEQNYGFGLVASALGYFFSGIVA